MLLERTIICFGCKAAMLEDETLPAAERRPCEHCGSRERAVQIITAGFIRSLDDLRVDFTHTPAEPEPARRGAEHLVIVLREFVPDRDLYTERVEDEATGEVLWQLETPLRELRRSAR